MFFVYILYSSEYDKFYVGQTNNIEKRLLYHNAGYNASTKPYIPWQIVCVISKPSRTEAMSLERKLKNLNKQRLKQFIEKYGSPGS